MAHPLASNGSTESLPTPPRSPVHSPALGRGSAVDHAPHHPEKTLHHANRPLDHPPVSLEASLGPSTPATGGGGDYFLGGHPLTPTTSSDPLLLASRLQSAESITALRKRGGKGGERSAGFYERQNSQIEGMLKSLDTHISEAEEEEDANRTAIKIAIYGSLICNCILAILQLYAAISSLSLSIFGTAIDSVFDPAANFVLNWCHRRALRVDHQEYPGGGSKFETIGDIVYSMTMGAVSLILVAFSIQDLARQNHDKELHIPALIVVGIAFATKLALFLYCYSIRSKNSQVRVLWEDHRNDLFINGFGLFTSAAGAKIQWWIDPAGALVISLFLIYAWGNTCATNFRYLAGKAAPGEFINLVTYKAMTFAPHIEQIDSVQAYHNGPRYVVEVDLVMRGETTLRVAHDVSQALQDKLEELPQVDRAYVHVDHEVSHKPEHRKTK
ncbi:hypothetical protein JCM11251_002311 [Rhodosporidiobolus azoricus]